MGERRVRVLYTGRVQGVGFRYACKQVALGFEVTGTVRNLDDGRVELILEGEAGELKEFQQAVREAGVGALIRNETEEWAEALGDFKGFEIIR